MCLTAPCCSVKAPEGTRDSTGRSSDREDLERDRERPQRAEPSQSAAEGSGDQRIRVTIGLLFELTLGRSAYANGYFDVPVA